MTSIDSLLASTCSFLDQAKSPPPSLREILGAYNTKGDGDRDMLLAVLNAKSAEEQRLASVAALQRTFLQLVEAYPPSPSQVPGSAPPQRDQPDPEIKPSPLPRSRTRHSSLTSSAQRKSARDSRPSRSRTATTATPLPRKRQRVSPSSASTTSSGPVPTAIKSDPEVSPSPSSSGSSQKNVPTSPPQSWSSKESPEYSPRTRASMAIGSLLSSQRDSQGGFHGSRDPGSPAK